MEPQNSQRIAREKEAHILDRLWDSTEAELVALYGRRRVGKTFLVRSILGQRIPFFELTGVKDGSTRLQLDNFAKVLSRVFYPGISVAPPKTWHQAFDMLVAAIDARPPDEKTTIFLDELPWLASPRSGLLQALDHAWNAELSRRPKVRLIACGSAASWMMKNVINAKGGLYNRVTRRVHLRPFSMLEAAAYLKSRGVRFTPMQMITTYLALGGVPYYLRLIEPELSAMQALHAVCLAPEAPLSDEFDRVFASLFEHDHEHQKIVKELAKHRYGVERKKLVKLLGKRSGGRLSNRMTELEASGFIRAFTPYGKDTRDTYYRLVDEFTLFCLRWMIPVTRKGGGYTASGWQSQIRQPSWHSWAGYAFEGVCLKHADVLQDLLAFSEVPSQVGTWRHVPRGGRDGNGAQIDLLYDRDDGVLSLCEVKYRDGEYALDRGAARSLMHKLDVFQRRMKPRKRISLSLITSGSFRPNAWSQDLIERHASIERWMSDRME
jgi:AAA+ ATPase superfamily predicted ATPase